MKTFRQWYFVMEANQFDLIWLLLKNSKQLSKIANTHSVANAVDDLRRWKMIVYAMINRFQRKKIINYVASINLQRYVTLKRRSHRIHHCRRCCRFSTLYNKWQIIFNDRDSAEWEKQRDEQVNRGRDRSWNDVETIFVHYWTACFTFGSFRLTRHIGRNFWDAENMSLTGLCLEDEKCIGNFLGNHLRCGTVNIWYSRGLLTLRPVFSES